jgi:hypothetical protein
VVVRTIDQRDAHRLAFELRAMCSPPKPPPTITTCGKSPRA